MSTPTIISPIPLPPSSQAFPFPSSSTHLSPYQHPNMPLSSYRNPSPSSSSATTPSASPSPSPRPKIRSGNHSNSSSLDTVPEDESLARKRTLLARAGGSGSEPGHARARRRYSDEPTQMANPSHPWGAQKTLDPSPSTSTLKPRIRYPPTSTSTTSYTSTQTQNQQPDRRYSDAAITLERERAKVEKIRGKRRESSYVESAQGEWVIDLDGFERGVEEWERGERGRVVMMIGEPSLVAIKPVLESTSFANTLIVIHPSPSNPANISEPSAPERAIPHPSQKSSRLSIPSVRSRASSPDLSGQSSRLTSAGNQEIQQLVQILGSGCYPQVIFRELAGKSLGEMIKDTVEFAKVWRGKRREEGRLLAGRIVNGLERPRPVSVMSTDSSSPLGSRRSSMDLLMADNKSGLLVGLAALTGGGGSAKPADMSRSRRISGLLSPKPKDKADPMEEQKKDGAIDAIVNFIPEGVAGDHKEVLQNVLVTSTTALPYLNWREVQKGDKLARRNSTYSMADMAAAGSDPFVAANGIPQSLIHVLPTKLPGNLVQAIDKYLAFLFPQPSNPHDDLASAQTRAYALGRRVLEQPMKRASDSSAASGLGLILSGAVKPIENPSAGLSGSRAYLEGLKNCRFVFGSERKGSTSSVSSGTHESETIPRPRPMSHPMQTSSRSPFAGTGSSGSLEPPRMSSDEISLNGSNPSLTTKSLPTTPPLDYCDTSSSAGDSHTRPSSLNLSLSAASISGMEPRVVDLTDDVSSMMGQERQDVTTPKKGKKTGSWTTRLFSRKSTMSLKN